MINIAVIGFGYWGPNIVRNFNALSNCNVSCVADLRQERIDFVKKAYPNINVTTSTDDVINSKEIDAIVIATPVFTHFTLAKKALA